MPLRFDIQQEGKDFYATVNGGNRFFVGRRVPYEGRIGLYNVFPGSPAPRTDFKPSNYTAEFGFWSEFIDPTAECEGRNFMTLNSYDRAAFTFGFGQFAAHVANGDFVKYLRVMLQRPEAADYFPDLRLSGGRIARMQGGTATLLETASSTHKLMAYLNPDPTAVDAAEAQAAARLIHWTQHHRPARLAQIRVMIDTYRGFMRAAATRGLIEGRTADQCCVIADILHQGRGGKGTTWPKISAALNSAKPFENLIEIGTPKWRKRVDTLAAKIRANPNMRARRWNGGAADFV